MLQLTDSAPSRVGITTALQFLPMLLFGLYGGVLADRYPKRRAAAHHPGRSWALLGARARRCSTLTGVVAGLARLRDGVPARPDRLSSTTRPGRPSSSRWSAAGTCRNAVALNAATSTWPAWSARRVAGVLITVLGGTGRSFLVNGLSFVAVIAGLILMRTSELTLSEAGAARQGPAPRGPAATCCRARRAADADRAGRLRVDVRPVVLDLDRADGPRGLQARARPPSAWPPACSRSARWPARCSPPAGRARPAGGC